MSPLLLLGDQDTDVVGLVMRPNELGSGLTAYDVPWKQYSGYGHGQLNADPFVAWPDTQECYFVSTERKAPGRGSLTGDLDSSARGTAWLFTTTVQPRLTSVPGRRGLVPQLGKR